MTAIVLKKGVEDNLEGDVDVHLAPVFGKDMRRQLPRQMFERRPLLFLAKLFFAMGLIAVAWVVIWLQYSWQTTLFAIVVNGLMYAHLIELQHECLHGHAFKSPALNRFYGVICGIFMIIPHSHYRYDHLRHHAYLGTPRNHEHFDYRFQNLDSIFGFVCAFFDLSRFKRVIKMTVLTLLWRPLPGIEKKKYDRDIKQEYLLYFFLFIASVAYTVQTGSWLMLLAWWLPSLLIAEGVHFLIEMPEHFGLNTQTNPNVLTNTRTIRTSKLVGWFVNGNDVHTAHHYHQGMPMCHVRSLHSMIASDISTVESSYRSFFWRVIKGDVRQLVDESCMKR